MTAHHGFSVLVAALTLATPAESSAQKRQRDVLTAAEIQESAVKSGTLFSAIRSLRPHFLVEARGVRTLGNSIIEPLAVYIDGTRQTDVDALRTIQATAVAEVRFLGPSAAGNQFGPKASGGALLVKLIKGADKAAPAPVTPPPPVPASPPPPPST